MIKLFNSTLKKGVLYILQIYAIISETGLFFTNNNISSEIWNIRKKG